jgi:hypothetical protein
MPPYQSPIDRYMMNRQTAMNSNTSPSHVLYNNHNLYNDHSRYAQYQNIQVLYNPVDITNWIQQPNLTRWRHRYNGVKESLKINQEIGQYYYDIHILETRHNSINDFLQILLDDVEYGVDYVQVQSNVGQPAYDQFEAISTTGMKDIITNLENLRQRVRDLEAQHG